MEFLVTMTTHVPPGTTEEAVDAVRRREAAGLKSARPVATYGTLSANFCATSGHSTEM